MRIIYVRRGKKGYSILRRFYHRTRDSFFYLDQEGFFEAALANAGVVKEIDLEGACQELKINNYDWLVINWKQSGFSDEEERSKTVLKILEYAKLPTALFVGAAQAGYLPPDTVLDKFDVIFKREPYKDRNRYNISDANKAKIVPTMISCPFVHAPRDNWLSKTYHVVRPKVRVCDPEEAVVDVGFSGADAAEHSIRRDVWQRVIDEGFSTIGGLQTNPYTKEPIPEALRGPRFKGKKYRDALCAAKINLALPGIGEYTFRHQELLYLGAFMLSHDSITEQELSMPLEAGKHYIAFSDLDDMVEKIRYYLAHEDERRAIAVAGKRLFDEYYDINLHAKQLFKSLSV